MDINHLERAHSLGRKNWLFCGSVDRRGPNTPGHRASLITTCRLYGVDTYTYFVDVLQQRVTHSPESPPLGGWRRQGSPENLGINTNTTGGTITA
jgi:hypothetical protein